MAQLKLELKKEVFVPWKVIVKMEEEPYVYPTYSYDDDYFQGQHWKAKNSQYN